MSITGKKEDMNNEKCFISEEKLQTDAHTPIVLLIYGASHYRMRLRAAATPPNEHFQAVCPRTTWFLFDFLHASDFYRKRQNVVLERTIMEKLYFTPTLFEETMKKVNENINSGETSNQSFIRILEEHPTDSIERIKDMDSYASDIKNGKSPIQVDSLSILFKEGNFTVDEIIELTCQLRMEAKPANVHHVRTIVEKGTQNVLDVIKSHQNPVTSKSDTSDSPTNDPTYPHLSAFTQWKKFSKENILSFMHSFHGGLTLMYVAFMLLQSVFFNTWGKDGYLSLSTFYPITLGLLWLVVRPIKMSRFTKFCMWSTVGLIHTLSFIQLFVAIYSFYRSSSFFYAIVCTSLFLFGLCLSIHECKLITSCSLPRYKSYESGEDFDLLRSIWKNRPNYIFHI